MPWFTTGGPAQREEARIDTPPFLTYHPRSPKRRPVESLPEPSPLPLTLQMYAWAMTALYLKLPHRLIQDEMVGCMIHWPGDKIKPNEATR